MTTIGSSTTTSDRLPLESIPVVDLRLLSQSELNSLSLCSNDAFDLNRCDDVVIPKIDRSVFNESAGSRKQTYCRLRLAPRKPGFLPANPSSNPAIDEDPEIKENKRIISLLRGMFGKDDQGEEDESTKKDEDYQLTVFRHETPEPLNEILPPTTYHHESMKKRGRKRKAEHDLLVQDTNVASTSMEIVNKNGVVVDIDALGKVEDPFGPELRRRTLGLHTEEQLLGFLRGVHGQWGSRRKKRKIIEASEFGDALPVGWKLLLSLKRKEGLFWLICRRYISPNGQQFASCKEVSSYLLSVFGSQSENPPNSHHDDESDHEVYELASGSTAGLAYKDDNTSDELICYSASPIASLASEHGRQVALLGSENLAEVEHGGQVALLGTENLAEVEIRDLLECHICQKNFEEKDSYLQHLLSSHQRSAKRCRPGTSICDGVIIKDGKYECQFCHKSFHERRRYNSHVGVHVRNHVKSLEAPPGRTAIQKDADASSMTGLPLRISQVDASVPPTSTASVGDERKVDSHVKLDGGSYWETSANSNDSPNSTPGEQGIRNSDPQTFAMESSSKNIDSHVKLDAGSYLETSTTNVGDERKVDSHVKLDGGCNIDSHVKLGVGSYLETSTTNVGDERKVDSHVKLDGGSYRETSANSNDTPNFTPGEQSIRNSDPPTFAMGSGSENIDSHVKLDAGSYLETSMTNSNDRPNSPLCELDTRDSNPQTFTVESSYEKVHSPLGNLGLSSIPEESTAKSPDELNVGSLDNKKDGGADKVDDIMGDGSHDKQDDGYETSVDKMIKYDSNNKQNSHHHQQDDRNSISQTFTAEFNFPLGHLGLSSFPQESTAKSSYELNVGSIYSKQETDVIELDENLGDRSLGKQDNGYEISADKVSAVDYISNNLNIDLSSCLESETFLCNNEETGTYDREGVSSNNNETDDPYLEQEGCCFNFFPVPSGSEKISNVETRTNEVSFFSLLSESKLAEAVESGSIGPENGFDSKDTEYDEIALMGTIGGAEEENMLQRVMDATSSPLVQPSDCFPTLSMLPDKGVGEMDSLNQKLENVSGFEELRLGDMDSSKYEFGSGMQSNSLPRESMELGYDALEPGLQFEWETMLPKMDSRQQLTSVCTWCRVGFTHETVDPDIQSDPVGFMCPSCKIKFSGQLWTMGCQ